MGMGPAAVPHVQNEIERVVSDVNVGDAIAADRQQQGFHRRPFATGRLETEHFLIVLPVQVEGDEPAAVPVRIEGEVLVDEIDSIRELPPNSAAHPVNTSRPLNPRPAGLSIVTSGAIVVVHRSSSCF